MNIQIKGSYGSDEWLVDALTHVRQILVDRKRRSRTEEEKTITFRTNIAENMAQNLLDELSVLQHLRDQYYGK